MDRRTLSIVSATAWLILASAVTSIGDRAAAAITVQDAVGYTALKATLGPALPIGRNVRISQVEAGGSSFLVNPNGAAFNGTLDPAFDVNNPAHPAALKVIVHNESPSAGSGTSAHSTDIVGARFFGDIESMAPGANEVWIYEANKWLEDVIDYDGVSAPDLQKFNYWVQNHSWVHTLAPGSPPPNNPPQFTPDPNNPIALRRFDYAVDRANGDFGMTSVVGLNNNTLALPYLLAYSYNAISVGLSSGNHSSGLTLDPGGASAYGPAGRSKPDIVAPQFGATSGATAFVSGAATMLYESAGATDARRNEVMKSILMAGATKVTSGPNAELASWSHTATQPLDDTFGAGELNILNSYKIQLGGKHAGSANTTAAPVGSYGWDYQNRKGQPTTGNIYYNFEIPDGSTASEFSVILAWNLEVADPTASTVTTPPQQELTNLNLKLYKQSSGLLGAPLSQSISTVDNVEHIYFTSPDQGPAAFDPGLYTLEVSGLADWDYGISWRMTTLFDEENADFDGSGAVDGADFLAWQRNFGTLVNAVHADGDADGDGDVDAQDYSLYKAGVMPAPVQAALRVAAAAVPEPASAALATLALAAIAGARRRRAATC